jgi:serine/threonine protein kinase
LACARHPLAATHRYYCAACLLEEALTPADIVAPTSMEASDEKHRGGTRHLTIQMPLGESASASVFLVKGEHPDLRFLRLKTWHRPAAPGFLARFQQLQEQLEGWDCEAIVPPLAASIDATGCPSVLSGFRQGVPILDRVKSGRLDPDDACARLTPLIELTHRAHARGLVHGSIVPGNVIIQPGSASACLLDFGLAPLFAVPGGDVAFRSADLAGFAALARTLGELPARSAPLRRL